MASDMRIWQNKLLREYAANITGTVLNVGAGEDKDAEGGFYRGYFLEADEYKTMDRFPGCDFHHFSELTAPKFDTVLCLWVLEHVYDIFTFVKDLHRITGTRLILAVPTKYPYHPAPEDFWRFTLESVGRLMQGFELEHVHEFDNKTNHGGIFVVGRKK